MVDNMSEVLIHADGSEDLDYIGDAGLFASDSEVESGHFEERSSRERVTSTASTSAESDLGRNIGRSDAMRFLWSFEEMCQGSSSTTRMIQLVLSAYICEDESDSSTCIEEDRDWLSDYYDLPDDDDDGAGTHPCVLRLELCTSMLREAGVRACDIRRTLLDNSGRKLHVTYSDLPSDAPAQFVRIRTRMAAMGHEPRAFLLYLLLQMLDLPVRACLDMAEATAKRARYSSQTDGAHDVEDVLNRKSIAALRHLRVEFDGLRKESTLVSAADHKAKLLSFRSRTNECLAKIKSTKSVVTAHASELPPSDVMGRRPSSLASEDLRTLICQCCTELFTSTNETVQKMFKLPSEQRAQHHPATQLAREEWMSRFFIAELEDCVSLADSAIEHGMLLEN
eukprot:TRINITY_DN18009_c1_g5_i1.p1 TRINITY_DN18009_c1_g5~~TRINITY_DN18009_c1_g5_i1.p1  ORF type:complete len:410 (+),score=51.39 TRINITY_DN18009_c1_g5_i1:46-1230(+)